MKKLAVLICTILSYCLFPSIAGAFDFGYVDAAKIFSMYSETQKTKSFLEQEKAKLQVDLDKRKKSLEDLDSKYVDTAKKIQEHRDARREGEARKLENQLKTQRDQLANANMELQKFFEESQRKLYELEEDKMSNLSRTLDEVVDKVIQRIAAQKKLQAVFEKRFCYFGGQDITDEVIAALNAGAETQPAQQPQQKKRKKK